MFVGFAPYDSPTVAIPVALEDYDKHDVKAAKIAGIVLTAALAAQERDAHDRNRTPREAPRPKS